MYELVDRPVTALDRGRRLLIWSMRSWIAAMSARTCPIEVIAPAFAKWRILSGLQPFLRAMALLNRHGLENFAFCAPGCNHVSEHEAILVSLFDNMTNLGPAAVRQTLELLVEEEAVGNLLVCLAQLHEAMDVAGICPGA